MREVDRPSMRVIGLETRTTNADETKPEAARIPGRWQRLSAEGILKRVPRAKEPRIPIAVYNQCESDHAGPYTLLVGVEVLGGDAPPPGMQAVDVPAARCALFESRREMPRTLIQTWALIWRYFGDAKVRARSYTADVELHRAPDAVDVLVAIR